MLGGTGNDIISVEAAGDQIVETVGGGTADRVVTYVSYVLAAGVEAEFLGSTRLPIMTWRLTGLKSTMRTLADWLPGR